MSAYSTEHTYKETVLFSRDTPSEKHSSALPHTTRGLPDPEYGRVLRPRGGFATRTRFTHDKDSIAHRKVRAGFDGGVRTRALHDYGDYNLSTYSHGIHEYEYIGLKGTHAHEYHIAKVFMSMSTG